MAGTSTKTKVIGVRVPVALAEEWEAAAKKAGIAVGALVIDLAKRGGRLSAHPILPPSKTLAVLRADPAMKAIDPKVHHVSGPVLADAVPRAVEGQAVGFNPKKSWKTDDDKGKSKR